MYWSWESWSEWILKPSRVKGAGKRVMSMLLLATSTEVSFSEEESCVGREATGGDTSLRCGCLSEGEVGGDGVCSSWVVDGEGFSCWRVVLSCGRSWVCWCNKGWADCGAIAWGVLCPVAWGVVEVTSFLSMSFEKECKTDSVEDGLDSWWGVESASCSGKGETSHSNSSDGSGGRASSLPSPSSIAKGWFRGDIGVLLLLVVLPLGVVWICSSPPQSALVCGDDTCDDGTCDSGGWDTASCSGEESERGGRWLLSFSGSIDPDGLTGEYISPESSSIPILPSLLLSKGSMESGNCDSSPPANNGCEEGSVDWPCGCGRRRETPS